MKVRTRPVLARVRVLKPGGRAVFKEPVRASRLLRLARAFVPYRRSDVSPFERPLTLADVEGEP